MQQIFGFHAYARKLDRLTLNSCNVKVAFYVLVLLFTGRRFPEMFPFFYNQKFF